ncbi:hypothetical protein MUCCIDRAFT_106493 [Mucor lusitanicus CBS 277.49]|uniref:Uncharacterized protein n=1 Tax=Mucor lusitanicus CBS 277.49 TaxID=747725 RepID=A0A168N8B7_MUCCL|nr:hypothetical protein MUCCIDRAFT_106493 [Mucor lusitanicus CBS 277.49]
MQTIGGSLQLSTGNHGNDTYSHETNQSLKAAASSSMFVGPQWEEMAVKNA